MRCLLVCLLVSTIYKCGAQTSKSPKWFSLGGRSTISVFGEDGAGIGTGGQFRIQPGKRVNTEWFADYITVSSNDVVRSEYYHIGWSVMYYLFPETRFFQPYLLAGHCFDFNRKTIIAQPAISGKRWGSAVQVGLGSHLNLTDRFDVTISCQYMIHLTNDLEAEFDGGSYEIVRYDHQTLQGHLLVTFSFNYKIFQL